MRSPSRVAIPGALRSARCRSRKLTLSCESLPQEGPAMPSPYPITALFGSLLYIMRHEPESREHRGALLAALRRELPPGDLLIDTEDDSLRLGGIDVPLDAPGASLLAEQMRAHGVRPAVLPADIPDEDLLRFTAVLAAFGGTYNSFDEVLMALGPTAERITLTRGAEGLDLFRGIPWQPRSMFDSMKTEDLEARPPGDPEAVGPSAIRTSSNELYVPPNAASTAVKRSRSSSGM